MPGLVLDDFLDRIVVGNTNQLISEIWNQDKVIWQFDKVPPELIILTPTGTSSDSPTYIQNDSTQYYTVSGTVSDTSGIKSLTVNGTSAEVNEDGSWGIDIVLDKDVVNKIIIVAIDKAGNETRAIRYVQKEAYYQYAARIAGTTPQESLDATLRNATVCSALASNPTAYGIMATHYKDSLSTYNTNYFSSALNLLCYRCKARTYLLKGTDTCSNITGGWTGLTAVSGGYTPSGSASGSRVGYTKSNINVSGFTRATASLRKSSGNGNIRFGQSSVITDDTYDANSGLYMSAAAGTSTAAFNLVQKTERFKVSQYDSSSHAVYYIYIS